MPDVDVGAMAWDQQVATVERLVSAALAGGAKLEIGGHRVPGPGLLFQPTCSQAAAIDVQ